MFENFLKKVCFFMPFFIAYRTLKRKEKIVLSLTLIYLSKKTFFYRLNFG